MTHLLNGATRVHFIVGDPIAQVKSPAGVTETFQQLGMNAFVMPAHVRPADLATWARGVSLAQNVDGIIVTVPHKFASFELCSTSSKSAQFLRAVNTLRRNTDGTWHGDMFDGLAFVKAMRDQGCELHAKRALLVGAGGAGSAIAHALVTSGVSELAIHDEDNTRRKSLIDRLNTLGLCPVIDGGANPSGFGLVINATPVGMKEFDPLPIQVELLTSNMLVGCVITAPAITPLIAAARAKGCVTVTGAEMFANVRDLMVDFLQGN